MMELKIASRFLTDEAGKLRRLHYFLLVDALEARALQGGVKVLRTDASITALPFFLARGYRVVREQQVKRGEQTLTNYALEREL